MSDDILYVTHEELDALPYYPAATGGPLEEVPVGTLWKRKDRPSDPWLIGEWTGKIGQGVRILWKEARTCTIQERIRMIREEKLAEFHEAWGTERNALLEKTRELTDMNLKMLEERNQCIRERDELAAWKQSMVDQALALMTSPLYVSAPGKALEARLAAIEKDMGIRTEDRQLRLNFCKLYNVVNRAIECSDIRRDAAERYAALTKVMEECKAFIEGGPQTIDLKAMGPEIPMTPRSPLFMLNAKLEALENLFDVLDLMTTQGVVISDKNLEKAYNDCVQYF